MGGSRSIGNEEEGLEKGSVSSDHVIVSDSICLFSIEDG